LSTSQARTKDNDLVIECGKCKHTWVTEVDLPMSLGDYALLMMRSGSKCPKCEFKPGRNSTETIYLLTGPRRAAVLYAA